MSELTQEYFEQHLQQQLKAQTTDLKAYAREQTEELARLVADGFEDLQARLDLREQLAAHERKFQKLEEALHLKL